MATSVKPPTGGETQLISVLVFYLPQASMNYYAIETIKKFIFRRNTQSLVFATLFRCAEKLRKTINAKKTVTTNATERCSSSSSSSSSSHFNQVLLIVALQALSTIFPRLHLLHANCRATLACRCWNFPPARGCLRPCGGASFPRQKQRNQIRMV